MYRSGFDPRSTRLLNQPPNVLPLVHRPIAILSASLDIVSGLEPHSKHWFTTSFLHPAVFSYAIGSRKLSANEQFFVGAQTVVILSQTTQIKQGVSFIAADKVYTSTNKTAIVF